MTALGIYNPNSKYNRSRRAAHVAPLPLSRDGEIFVLNMTIRAIENLRAFHYGTGNLYGARLQAIRLGKKRRELRALLCQ